MGPPPPMWIALCLALGPAVSNGIGRFAYALILPAMRADLSWTYTQAGWVNTVNALGYLAGALAVMRFVGRVGARRFFDVGMVLTGVALVGSGLTRSYGALLAFRFVTGASGAFAFIGGGALVAGLTAAHPARAASSIALYYAGGGAGILLSGVSLPWLFESRGAGAWDTAWLVLGVASLILCVPSLIAASRTPRPRAAATRATWRKRPLAASMVAYFLFAVGSIVYMTFIIAWVRGRGASATEVSILWGALGLAIVLSPLVSRPALERWRGGGPLAASLAACAVGAALPLWRTDLPTIVASALVFGGSFFIPPAAVTALARRALPAEAWSGAIAAYTVVFGIGQPLGPYLAGAIADSTGNLFAGLATSVVVLVVGAAVALAQGRATAGA